MAVKRETIVFEDARIFFKNFGGREGPYNAAGKRNFAVEITDEKTAQKMIRDGWNVKYTTPREEGDEPQAYISVNVNFEHVPPRIVMLTDTSRTNVTEDMVDVLDYASIEKVDLIVNASLWEVNGKSGIKGYLKSMFVTIEEDYLEKKYAVRNNDD